MSIINQIVKAVRGLLRTANVSELQQKAQISDAMGCAITQWFYAFYQQPAWLEHGWRVTNMPQVLTGTMATLAASELVVSSGTSARARFIDEQIARYLTPQLRRVIQLAGVGGQVILKPVPTSTGIPLDVVTADRFYPTRLDAAGVPESAYFTDFRTLHGKQVVRVEQHEMIEGVVRITNRAYWQGSDKLGGELPLTDVPEWADIAPDVTITGVDRLLFASLRMPFANTVDPASRLPVSLYANAMDALAELDRIYSEFLYEVHTGKRKRIVDIDAIGADPKQGGGIPFKDRATDLYLVLDREDSKPFDDYTPDLRIDDYQKALNIQCRLLEAQTGFSSGTFGFDLRTGRLTARQVISEDKDTYNMIKGIQDCGLQQGLLDLVYCMDAYASLYHLAPSGALDPSVSFGDSIFEDTDTEFARRKQMADGGYLKPEKLISWYFGISDEAAAEYIPEQSAEADPFGFGRGDA